VAGTVVETGVGWSTCDVGAAAGSCVGAAPSAAVWVITVVC
jgi:hypothetical protein